MKIENATLRKGCSCVCDICVVRRWFLAAGIRLAISEDDDDVMLFPLVQRPADGQSTTRATLWQLEQIQYFPSKLEYQNASFMKITWPQH